MDRLFLDANVLFSAAYQELSRLQTLWRLPDTTLLTSAYAELEARRNLPRADQLLRLEELMSDVAIVPDVVAQLPPGIQLPEKDWPILLAAVHSEATHLITGDNRHFGALFGTSIGGVLVVTPSAYLHAR